MTLAIPVTPERALPNLAARSTPAWLSEGSVNLDETLPSPVKHDGAVETLWNGYRRVKQGGNGYPFT
jgi:hypothetical protein